MIHKNYYRTCFYRIHRSNGTSDTSSSVASLNSKLSRPTGYCSILFRHEGFNLIVTLQILRNRH